MEEQRSPGRNQASNYVKHSREDYAEDAGAYYLLPTSATVSLAGQTLPVVGVARGWPARLCNGLSAIKVSTLLV